MTQWYVKDLSKLTGVSVQTMHHYDRIGLLKPSVRLANGYRLYSEKDLLRLQQIIALKFFGFELAQIKELLSNNAVAAQHFRVQSRLLSNKASQMLEANHALENIISEIDNDKSIPWETIIKLIEVYNMTKQLEHSWVKEIFTADELKEYATFETEWRDNSSAEQKAAFEKNWANLVDEVNQNLKNDPHSEIGVRLGRKCMELVIPVYGKKYAHLRTKKWERGFGEGKGLDEVGLTPESVAWLDKAVDSYLRDRVYGILSQIDSGADDHTIYGLWNQLLDDLYGEDDSRKKEIYQMMLADEKVSDKAKEWLRGLQEMVASNRYLL